MPLMFQCRTAQLSCMACQSRVAFKEDGKIHYLESVLLEDNLAMHVQVRCVGMCGQVSGQQRGSVEGMRVSAQQAMLGWWLGRKLPLLPR